MSADRKQVENMAKKKLDNLMKESKIRDREDPDSFTITALPPAGKTMDKTGSKVNTESKYFVSVSISTTHRGRHRGRVKFVLGGGQRQRPRQTDY